MLDIAFLINYLYRDGLIPIIDGIMDVNNSGATNILDVTYFINYLYKSGPDTNCPLY
ncbi:MAG: dockerin type I domain-containing protein [Candidatus Zixiibacteriota bacterium]